MSDFVKKPCIHCPFRNDVRPFLTSEFAEELAYAAQNPYSTFPCHKTTEEDEESGETIVTETSKECAGFLTLRASELGEDNVYECEEGFKPSYKIVYAETYDMIAAYEYENNRGRR